jgi:hypothetical protein
MGAIGTRIEATAILLGERMKLVIDKFNLLRSRNPGEGKIE